MPQILRTDSSNSDFQTLVKLLDADLSIRDGEEHAFYAQYNKTDQLKYVIVLYQDQKPVACGAIREFAEAVMEIGKNQPEAIQLYQKIGFEVIENYGQYAGIDNSVCMQKTVMS